jgi:hypothetical protein
MAPRDASPFRLHGLAVALAVLPPACSSPDKPTGDKIAGVTSRA